MKYVTFSSLYSIYNHISISNDLTPRAQVSILSERSEENEDDAETVVGFDYSDEEYDQNEDDYDSVPVDNNGLENDREKTKHDVDSQGCVTCIIALSKYP